MVGKLNRIIITAGGTGGHVFPALAVARAMREQGVDVLWVGTEAGIESVLVTKAGFPIEYIKISGLRGKGLLRLLTTPFKLARAVMQSLRITGSFAPDVVLGMGGFASGPCGLAAWIRRVPLCIQEQNAVAGLTNRVLARFAAAVMQAFPGAFADSAKLVTTGNPVRQEILRLSEPAERYQQHSDRLRVLIVGGSLGAVVLNEKIPHALGQLSKEMQLEVWHQTGKNRAVETSGSYQQQGVDARVDEFIDDMAQAYAWADLVICRAGALTVSELAAAGVASLLIPFPHAVDDHQTVNAQFLVNAGAARVLQQKDMTDQTLVELLRDLLMSGREKLRDMAIAARSVASPNATAQVVRTCSEVACGK